MRGEAVLKIHKRWISACFEIFLVLPVACHWQLSADCGPWVFDTLVLVVGNLETLHRFLNSVWRMG